MELSGSNIKKFLIFSQKKIFITFQETELFYISENGNQEKIFIFQETELSYISGKGKP